MKKKHYHAAKGPTHFHCIKVSHNILKPKWRSNGYFYRFIVFFFFNFSVFFLSTIRENCFQFAQLGKHRASWVKRIAMPKCKRKNSHIEFAFSLVFLSQKWDNLFPFNLITSTCNKLTEEDCALVSFKFAWCSSECELLMRRVDFLAATNMHALQTKRWSFDICCFLDVEFMA